jgi:hypothetical protein
LYAMGKAFKFHVLGSPGVVTFSPLPLLVYSPINNVALGIVGVKHPQYYAAYLYAACCSTTKLNATYYSPSTPKGVYKYDVRIVVGPLGRVENTMASLQRQQLHTHSVAAVSLAVHPVAPAHPAGAAVAHPAGSAAHQHK